MNTFIFYVYDCMLLPTDYFINSLRNFIYRMENRNDHLVYHSFHELVHQSISVLLASSRTSNGIFEDSKKDVMYSDRS